ncbi:MAG: class I SAM-dependent methyltransferase, partial [Flavobacterium sp.]|nr:class I SAM-dependent methyltransferase [Flavobacterium sp.]
PTETELPQYYESDDYISHTDGKRTMFEKAYQYIKNIALINKLKLINNLNPEKGKLLDIGAGTGDFLLVAKKNNWQITGIEPNEKARNITINKGIFLVEKSELLEKHSFDVITMWHVLEHVSDLELQIKELKRLLKPNGTILIAVPNFNSYDAKHYGSYWAAYDVPRHLWHFSKTAIKLLFLKQDLHLQKVIPMKFDAFYVALLSEKYRKGKMNLLKAFFVGLKSNFKGSQNLEYSSHIYVIKNNKN